MTFFLLTLFALSAADDEVKSEKKTLSAAERKEIAERVSAAAKKAVTEGDLARTEIQKLVGQSPFEDVSRLGGVLIGARFTTVQSGDRTIILSIEPIYLTTRNDVTGPKRGTDRDKFGRKVKSSLLQTEAIRAKPGYAVGALRVRLGVGLEAVGLTFMRINGDRLDPNDSYDAKWVGNPGPEGLRRFGGEGHLAVGIRGSEANKELQQYGLVLAGKDAPTKGIALGGPKGLPPAKAPKGGMAAGKAPAGLFKDSGAEKSEAAEGNHADASKKGPKSTRFDLTLKEPAWKWNERYSKTRIGDFAQYDLPEARMTKLIEVVEVGDRFVVLREKLLPINDQKIILMRFDEGDAEAPPMPKPEAVTVQIQGKDVACKRYVFPAEASGKKERQEVYSVDVPFDGLVGRMSDKGSMHLRRFARGPG
jgi:hypothetical protein